MLLNVLSVAGSYVNSIDSDSAITVSLISEILAEMVFFPSLSPLIYPTNHQLSSVVPSYADVSFKSISKGEFLTPPVPMTSATSLLIVLHLLGEEIESDLSPASEP
jgi:hypothetical protein